MFGLFRVFGTVKVWKIPYTESTLVIDIIDPSTNQLIWRGYDTETIDFNKSEKTINNSVEDLIKRFVGHPAAWKGERNHIRAISMSGQFCG